MIGAEGREGRWSFAFQSASHTNEPWLGPNILDHLQELVNKGQQDFLMAPIGFVSDHLEILYDIDIECRAAGEGPRGPSTRCESLNDSDELIGCLRSLVREKHFE